MTVGKYILRSVKYLIKLLVIFAILFAFMRRSETSMLSFDTLDTFIASYFATWRGWLFSIVVVLWCAIYPRVEFVVRHLDYDLVADKEGIVKALNAGGMNLVGESDGRMVFAGSGFRRIWYVWDDVVTLTANPAGGFDLEGPRRFVTEAMQRVPVYTGVES
jgi:hypothetical protein